MDVASLFGARHPAHAEDLRVATASARTAHACLACLFVSTMVGFTLLRAAGLKRVLVPRSGIIGVGVAWTIATGTLLALRASDATALALAPGTPAHALAVVFPAQTAFLSSLVPLAFVPHLHLLPSDPPCSPPLALRSMPAVGWKKLSADVVRLSRTWYEKDKADFLVKQLDELVVKAKCKYTVTTKVLQHSSRTKVSERTIRDALHRRDIWFRTLREKPVLTPDDVSTRLKFGKKYRSKSKAWWNKTAP